MRSGNLLWPQISAPSPKASPLQGDIDCEVAIVGGGISGVLAAWTLAAEGLDVVLLERGSFGSTSTAANTGLLLHETDLPLVQLIAQIGEPAAVHVYRRGLSAIDQLEALAEELTDDCGFRRVPTLYLASDEAGQRQVAQEGACRKAFGFSVELLDRSQLAEISTIAAPLTLRSAGNAQLNPYRLSSLALQRLMQRGLRAFAGSQVTEVRRSGGRLELVAGEGTVRARDVVYALGYATEDFLGIHLGDLNTTYAAASEPLATFSGWPDCSLIWETSRPYCYARQTGDGRIVIGGADSDHARDHQSDELVQRRVERIARWFERLFPEIPFQAAYAWAGTFGETADGLPRLGRIPGREHEFALLAYGGNGTTFSMIGARLVADLIVGRTNPDEPVFSFR